MTKHKMPNRLSAPVIILSTILPLSSAFGMDIHNQIGFMAETYLTPEAKYMVSQILEPEYNGSIGRAAHWPDTVSRTTHQWSYVWHWISALDDPPKSCNIYPNRDCQRGGCSVSQIANQTSILASCVSRLPLLDTSTYESLTSPFTSHQQSETNITCSESLKFISHFIGDTAQPLHNSERNIGGNTFPVLFNGSMTNMHKVWDSQLLHADSDVWSFGQRELHPRFVGLLERTQTDSFLVPRDHWILGQDPEQAWYWASEWAKDSNKINCDVVYGIYEAGKDVWVREEDQARAKYAEVAIPVIELQIAKAAWRLGGWLNGVAGKYLIVGADRDDHMQDRIGFDDL